MPSAANDSTIRRVFLSAPRRRYSRRSAPAIDSSKTVSRPLGALQQFIARLRLLHRRQRRRIQLPVAYHDQPPGALIDPEVFDAVELTAGRSNLAEESPVGRELHDTRAGGIGDVYAALGPGGRRGRQAPP